MLALFSRIRRLLRDASLYYHPFRACSCPWFALEIAHQAQEIWRPSSGPIVNSEFPGVGTGLSTYTVSQHNNHGFPFLASKRSHRFAAWAKDYGGIFSASFIIFAAYPSYFVDYFCSSKLWATLQSFSQVRDASKKFLTLMAPLLAAARN